MTLEDPFDEGSGYRSCRKSGSAVVEQALAAGHDVTAFVHRTEGYWPGSSVRVIEGDARDRLTMDSAMLGQNAVIDTIGGKLSFKTTTLEASCSRDGHCLYAVERRSPPLVTSVIGAGESIANTNWYERLFLSTLLRSEMKDKAAMEAIVDASGLGWTIVRLPFLTDDPPTGNIHVFSAETGEIAHKLTRADLAAFMVAQISSDQYLQKTVAVANS